MEVDESLHGHLPNYEHCEEHNTLVSSSINPAPEDLPDLLDSLIESDRELKEKLKLLDEMSSALEGGIARVRKRLEALRNR